MKEIKLEVPYYSQYLDIQDPFWMPRACGSACLKMVLEFLGAETPSMLEMSEKAMQERGYNDSGWSHDYLVQTAKAFGFDAHREEKMGEDGEEKLIEHLLKGKPVIISIVKFILEQTKFHMVVLVGVREGKEGREFLYHDPEATAAERGAFRVVKETEFKKGWRQMAIFIG